MSRPAVTELDIEGRDAFRATDDAVFIAYINPEDAASWEPYSAVAEKYRQEFTFGVVGNAAATEADDKVAPSVVSYINEEGGGETVRVMEITDQQNLDELVAAASRPKIGELTKQNQQRLLSVSTHSRSPFRDSAMSWS